MIVGAASYLGANYLRDHPININWPSWDCTKAAIAEMIDEMTKPRWLDGAVTEQERQLKLFEEYVNKNTRPDGKPIGWPDLDLVGPTIVELGAGDYSNAIVNKALFPDSRFIATNHPIDTEFGASVGPRGYKAEDNFSWRMWANWEIATGMGIEAGTSADQPIMNEYVSSDIANVVYTIMPYPTTGFDFGAEAARIAKEAPGTIISITGGANLIDRKGMPVYKFIAGVDSVLPGAKDGFVEIPGVMVFGTPGGSGDHRQIWEGHAKYSTYIYVIPNQ